MSEFDEEAILNMSDFDQGAVGATTTFAAPTSASSASSATTAAAATSGTGTDVVSVVYGGWVRADGRVSRSSTT